MYYTAAWQLLEEEINDDVDQNSVIDREVQYVWGLRYIDDALLRREDTDLDGSFDDKTRYYCTDVQFSPNAILDDAAAEVERVSYTPYGVARHHPSADGTGDGKTNVDDLLLVNNNWNTFGPGDVNRSGFVNSTDLTAVINDWGSEEPAGDLSYDDEDNIIGYDGYIYDEELQEYCVRFRHYIPELGRWAERDPAGYVDGSNLNEYAGGTPTAFIDPSGLNSVARLCAM